MDETTMVLVPGDGQRRDRLERARFRLETTEGVLFDGVSATVGSQEGCDVTLSDPTVSRFHCTVETTAQGFRIRDLESSNGTRVDGVRVREAFVESGAAIDVGNTTLRFAVAGEREVDELVGVESLHGMCGRSPAMRQLFGTITRVAPSDSTVLITGETGTGKEAVAEAIHASSPRADGPFVVVDCGAIPANLLESELFGHVKGAFTGAHADRVGAFEAAAGGTLLLDELGELPADLQPKLLRVLEAKTIRRLGATARRHVDVRIVGATHRDLREGVNEGSFRADLYYRLAVVHLHLPPLRERPDDLQLLVPALLDRMGVPEEERRPWLRPGFIADLQRSDWPGNIRQLRNHLERYVLMGSPQDVPSGGGSKGMERPPTTISYAAAREAALERFEREWLAELLDRCGGNVSKAARDADMSRPYLHRLLRRHGLR